VLTAVGLVLARLAWLAAWCLFLVFALALVPIAAAAWALDRIERFR